MFPGSVEYDKGNAVEPMFRLSKAEVSASVEGLALGLILSVTVGNILNCTVGSIVLVVLWPLQAAVYASVEGLALGSVLSMSVGIKPNCKVGSTVMVGAGLGRKLTVGAGLMVGAGVVAVIQQLQIATLFTVVPSGRKKMPLSGILSVVN